MKQFKKTLLLSIAIQIILATTLFAQSVDRRNVKHGHSIYSHGYCDQPYVVVLENGKWLCVFTTNAGHEGSKGQHIVASLQGITRSIEKR